METSVTGFTLLELFQMGGPLMWPLLLFSIATVGITIERGIYLLYHNLKLTDLRESVETAIRSGKMEEAREFLESKAGRRMGARILLTLVKRNDLSEHRLEKAVEAEAMSCVSSLENGFSYLSALGSISPLTGFLGTVTGMIGAFRAIAEAVDVNAQIVASGIYEALITTVFGLCIAIVAMSAHSLFTHIVDRFTSQVEVVCSDLIIVLTETIDYLPQNQLSVLPVLPKEQISRALVSKSNGKSSKSKGTVYLELLIDNQGNVRDVLVLREDPPDQGFGEAAVNAIKGIQGKPAEVNGVPVAARFRFNISFTLS